MLSGDLTGTLIESTQRVGVLSGNIRTSVGSGSSRDHLVAMLPTVESWGKLYCTVPIPGKNLACYTMKIKQFSVRVFISKRNTSVIIVVAFKVVQHTQSTCRITSHKYNDIDVKLLMKHI